MKMELMNAWTCVFLLSTFYKYPWCLYTTNKYTTFIAICISNTTFCICAGLVTELATNPMAYDTRRFNAAFTRTPIIPILSWINPIPRIGSLPISLRSILILASHLLLGLLKGLVPASVAYLLKFWKRSCLPPFWLHDLPISVFST